MKSLKTHRQNARLTANVCFVCLLLPLCFVRSPASPQETLNLKALLDNGEALYAQQEYEDAFAVFKKALIAAQRPPNQKAILTATRYISNCLYALGQYELALESYLQTKQLQQQAGDLAGVADTWLRLGNCYYALGDLDEAIDHYKQSFELAKETKTALVMAESLSSIGLAYFVQGENKLALDYYYQSLNHYATAGDKDGIAQALQSVGNANFRLQNYRLAFEAFQNARFLLTESGKVDEAHEALLAIGLVHFAQKSYAFAMEAYQKSLTHFEGINNKSLVALALYRIGLVKYAEENFVDALSFAERAANFATQAESHETLWRAQFEIGRAQLRLQQSDKAKQSWLQSVATIEKMRSNLRGNDTDSAVERTAPFIGLVELLVAENNPVEAFHYAERAKAQILWGILQGSRHRITKTLTPAEAENEQRLRREALTLSARLDRAKRKNADAAIVQRLREQLQTARTALTTLTNQLYVQHPQLKVYRGEAPPLKAGEAYALVNDPKRALLEFVVTENQVLLFVLTKTPKQTQLDLNTYKLDANAETLQDRVVQLREQITSKSEEYPKLARELFDALVKPAQVQLAGKTSLTIVPDGILWALPFAALQPSDKRFWIEDCAINYASSVSALREMNKLVRMRPATTAPSLLAIAPVDGDAALLEKLKLAPSPSAEHVAPQWQQLYARSKLQLGHEAREANVQQSIGAHGFVHFVAPALVNNYRPLYSFVMLSPADATKPKTGFLPMWKLTNWNLKAELLVLPDAVVLPVERRSGNGFTGVSWASYVAGSSGTLVSQWQVDNTEWLTALHQQLKTRAPNATQQATIRLLQRPEFRHPAHWAGFAVLGATR